MQKENLDEREILNTIDNSITQLDEQRIQELGNLRQAQEIKNEVFKLERTRLANKYGADHPRVQHTTQRLEYNQEMFSGLDKEIERSAVKPDPLPLNAWRLHGKVFDAKNTPVKGVTVFLSDQRKTWIEELGSDCTDDWGYYSLTVDEKIIARFEKQPLFPSVSDANKKVIYLDPVPLFATRGLIDYKDIYLNGEECTTPPPPSPNPAGNDDKGPRQPSKTDDKDTKGTKTSTKESK